MVKMEKQKSINEEKQKYLQQENKEEKENGTKT